MFHLPWNRAPIISSVGLSKVRLSLIHSVLNAAATCRLISRLTSLPSCLAKFIGSHSCLSFTSTFLHWFTDRILVKLSTIYVTLSACLPLPSHRPLRSLHRHDLFVPWSMTSTCMF